MNKKQQDELKKLLKKLGDACTGLSLFLEQEVLNFVPDDHPGLQVVKPSVKDVVKTGLLFCEVCSKEIVPVDVVLKGVERHFDAEQIAWFSQREFGKNVCWGCQNEQSSL